MPTVYHNLQSIKTYIFLENCSQSSSINNPSCFVITKVKGISVKFKKLLLIKHKSILLCSLVSSLGWLNDCRKRLFKHQSLVGFDCVKLLYSILRAADGVGSYKVARFWVLKYHGILIAVALEPGAHLTGIETLLELPDYDAKRFARKGRASRSGIGCCRFCRRGTLVYDGAYPLYTIWQDGVANVHDSWASASLHCCASRRVKILLLTGVACLDGGFVSLSVMLLRWLAAE